jgi:hypothetical protein
LPSRAAATVQTAVRRRRDDAKGSDAKIRIVLALGIGLTLTALLFAGFPGAAPGLA